MRFLFIFSFIVLMSVPVKAQGLSVIRDTEIENILQAWIKPILEAAGLSESQVDLALINSNQVNAFVAGGANVFIYAGLILKAEYPEEVLGVMAHEIGHITGGHLIATRNAMDRASFQSILATVLGVGAAILTRDSGAVGAVSAGGSGAALNGFLSHSRIQESSADQAGLKYLEGAEVNPAGMVTFLEKLEDQELLPASHQSEYLRTHPLTRDRIDSMRVGAKRSHLYTDLGVSSRQNDFNMMKAKLLAFIEPQNIPRYYDDASGDTDAKYAHAIMNYRQSQYDKAIKIFDELINENPKNPYFIEMKAQTLRDSGRLDESEKFYKRALNLLDNRAPLIQVALAHVMIEQQKNTKYVEDILLSSLQNDTRNAHTYRLLATIKGRQDLEADAQYYLAEEAMSQGRRQEAKRLLHLAKESGNLSQSLVVKANDLEIFLNRLPIGDN